MNVMYEFIKRKFIEGKIFENDLYIAVEKGWITQDELVSIMNLKY